MQMVKQRLTKPDVPDFANTKMLSREDRKQQLRQYGTITTVRVSSALAFP